MKHIIASAVIVVGAAGSALAGGAQVQVTIESLAQANGVALSPFTVGFHDGSFDSFDNGSAANAATQNIAEFGNGAQWMTDFAASQPNGVAGVVVATTNAFGPGIYLPGATGSMTFNLDPAMNRFFSYGAMVVPSNDRFVGNDNPMGIEIFDAGGNFVASSFTVFASQIWDAGTEVDGTFGAAFIVGSSAGDHTPQAGVVSLNGDFSAYGGQATPAGYDFIGLPGPNDPVVRISFAVVPAPGATSMGLMTLGMLSRRRR